MFEINAINIEVDFNNKEDYMYIEELKYYFIIDDMSIRIDKKYISELDTLKKLKEEISPSIKKYLKCLMESRVKYMCEILIELKEQSVGFEYSYDNFMHNVNRMKEIDEEACYVAKIRYYEFLLKSKNFSLQNETLE